MIKKYQIFTIKDYEYANTHTHDGPSINLVPLWKENKYSNECYIFKSYEEAEEYLLKTELPKNLKYIILPIFVV